MDCECDIVEGGFCRRHAITKSAHWVHLCRTRDNYWRAWEEGRGPGQQRKPGLGDMVEAGLSRIGITEKRVSRLLGRPCGCGRRKRKLNELGRKLGIGR